MTLRITLESEKHENHLSWYARRHEKWAIGLLRISPGA